MSDQLLKELTEIKELLKKLNSLQKDVFTLAEACDYLGIAPSYAYKLSSNRQLPTYCPLGKKLYFKKSELVAWCLRNRQATEAELEQESINYITKKTFKDAI